MTNNISKYLQGQISKFRTEPFIKKNGPTIGIELSYFINTRKRKRERRIQLLKRLFRMLAKGLIIFTVILIIYSIC